MLYENGLSGFHLVLKSTRMDLDIISKVSRSHMVIENNHRKKCFSFMSGGKCLNIRGFEADYQKSTP